MLMVEIVTISVDNRCIRGCSLGDRSAARAVQQWAGLRAVSVSWRHHVHRPLTHRTVPGWVLCKLVALLRTSLLWYKCSVSRSICILPDMIPPMCPCVYAIIIVPVLRKNSTSVLVSKHRSLRTYSVSFQLCVCVYVVYCKLSQSARIAQYFQY